MEVTKKNKQKKMLRDKIQGVIFGAALGDAVGLATEFMSKGTAKLLYGTGPIKFGKAEGYEFWRDGHRKRWHDNDFTDDTDQLLLILQCLLTTNGYLVPEQFAFRLREWTDLGFPELGNKLCCGVGFTVGSVIGHPKFLSDPHKAAFDVWFSKGCNLAANGAVIRTAVLGIPHFIDESEVVENAIKAAKVTHADPRSIFSAVVVSALISRIFRRDLGIGDESKMDDEKREKLLKYVDSETTADMDPMSVTNKGATSGAAQTSHASIADLYMPKTKLKKKPHNFLQTVKEKVEQFGRESDSKWPEGWPNHKDPDNSRLNTPAKCSSDPDQFSTSSCGQDDPSMKLIDDVVSDYKFLLNTKHEAHRNKWLKEMHKYCYPNSLDDLDLDEKNSLGFTLKCLGSALFCYSRRHAADMKKEEFFMKVITELTLEAGDADTNGAVAGALLGARLGMKELPSVWLQGLRNREFLMKISEELLELVVKQIN